MNRDRFVSRRRITHHQSCQAPRRGLTRKGRRSGTQSLKVETGRTPRYDERRNGRWPVGADVNVGGELAEPVGKELRSNAEGFR